MLEILNFELTYGVTSSIMTSSFEFFFQCFWQKNWTFVLYPFAATQIIMFDNAMSSLFEAVLQLALREVFIPSVKG